MHRDACSSIIHCHHPRKEQNLQRARWSALTQHCPCTARFAAYWAIISTILSTVEAVGCSSYWYYCLDKKAVNPPDGPHKYDVHSFFQWPHKESSPFPLVAVALRCVTGFNIASMLLHPLQLIQFAPVCDGAVLEHWREMDRLPNSGRPIA